MDCIGEYSRQLKFRWTEKKIKMDRRQNKKCCANCRIGFRPCAITKGFFYICSANLACEILSYVFERFTVLSINLILIMLLPLFKNI